MIKATEDFLLGKSNPVNLDYSDTSIKGRLRSIMKKSDRTIKWEDESIQKIVSKIHAADGAPGARAFINGKEFHLFGA